MPRLPTATATRAPAGRARRDGEPMTFACARRSTSAQAGADGGRSRTPVKAGMVTGETSLKLRGLKVAMLLSMGTTSGEKEGTGGLAPCPLRAYMYFLERVTVMMLLFLMVSGVSSWPMPGLSGMA